MSRSAAVTVHRSPEQVKRLWEDPAYRSEYLAARGASVRFVDAPGDRGTEIHVALADSQGAGGKVMEAVAGSAVLAKVKDELRHFKQQVETGEIPRSDSVPEGERAERKLKQRPAQPLTESELEEVRA
jgi:hypothetical protein